MLNSILSPWPSFSQEEIDAASAVLLSNKVNYWTGDIGRKFESEFAEYSGTKHAIAVANGTVALDLIYHGLGIGSVNGGSKNDEVIVTSRTFLASVSSIINAGAIPIFIDVDSNSQNIDPECVAAAITENTKAVLCVHLSGWPCDVDAIFEKFKGRDIKIVEDCAQAHGAKYKGKPVGSLGVAAGWSFCQDKIMSTGGEGGMVTCDDDALWRRMWAFKDHGKNYDTVYNQKHPTGFRWLHESIGTNWRLTEIQSAIGRIQLGKMNEWNKARNENARMLAETFKPFSGGKDLIRLPQLRCADCDSSPNECCHNAWYKFYVFVRPENLPKDWNRDKIIAALVKIGVPCFQGSCSEVYLEKAFDKHPSKPKHRLKNAKELGETSLMFLVHPTISKKEIKTVCNQITRLLQEISRAAS